MYPAIEHAAVVASAIYGVLRGARQGFDLVGICCLACAVAFGGGTLRDLMLDRHPIFWIGNDRLLWTVFALALTCAFIPEKVSKIESLLWIPDTLGLALFSTLGAAYSLNCGTSRFVAVLMAVVTGAFGGVIADVICNQLPQVFQRSPLYATCSFVGGSSFVLLKAVGIDTPIAMGVGFSVTAILRIVAVKWNLTLPSRSLRVE